MAERAPVVIIGGGIVGAASAYYLSLRNTPVVVLESETVAAAASGKAGGFLARNWGSGPVRQLHVDAFDLHAELASTLHLTSYRTLTTLSVQVGAPPPTRPASHPAWLTGPGVGECEDMEGPSAQVTPLELTTALMDAAVGRGAVLRTHTPAIGLERDPSSGAVTGVRVAGGGVLPASHVVIATGPWGGVTSSWLGLSLPMVGVASASAVFRSPQLTTALSRSPPTALFVGEHPVHGTHLEVYPRPNGEVYVCGIGGSDEVSGSRLAPGGDYDSASKVNPAPGRVQACYAALTELMPSVPPPFLTQACMRPLLPDGHPCIGFVPGAPNVVVAVGHNCWGILLGPLTGKLVAQLVVDGATSTPLKGLAPGRFSKR